MSAKFEDLRQSDEWGEYLHQLHWLSEKLKIKNSKCKIFIRKIPFFGSVIKIQRPSEVPPIEDIDRIAKKHRALFVKLEPSFALRASEGLRPFDPDNWPLVPTRTIRIGLTPATDEIFARFSKDARYSIRRAERNGVEVRSLGLEAGNLKVFYDLLKETGKRKRFWVPPEADLQAKAQAFKDKSMLLLAYHNRKPIAGALILFHDQVAYYHQAASNLCGRKLLAPYLVVWEVIKLSKKRGCHTLDLEGIYDPRYPIYKRFKKIGIFKKKFGGKEIEYPGSFIRYYNPFVKLIFKVANQLDFVQLFK